MKKESVIGNNPDSIKLANGEISNGFVFFYKHPNTSEVELYIISFFPGQGGEVFCFQIFDKKYQSNTIDNV